MKFRYEAKTRGGESARGEIEAADERAAASLLREKGLTPIDITPAGEKRDAAKYFRAKNHPRNGRAARHAGGRRRHPHTKTGRSPRGLRPQSTYE